MVLNRLVVVMVLALICVPAIAASAGADRSAVENRREYVLGGSMMGTFFVCTPQNPVFDVGAACDIPCPGRTCNITVIDDVHGTNIGFRICFEGETFCRPNRYFRSADVPGSKVTVVPILDGATHGVVIVR